MGASLLPARRRGARVWRVTPAATYNRRAVLPAPPDTRSLMSSTHVRKPLPPLCAALFCAAALLSLLSLPLSEPRAQPQADAPAQRPSPTPVELGDEDVLKIDTDLVLVEVTVTDAAGRVVKGLRPEDFKLYEDGEERPVAFLNVARRGRSEGR